MDPNIRDRAVDLWIGVSLALFPLLPTGPTYFGLDWPWALEAWLLLFLAAGLLIIVADWSRTSSTVSSRSGTSVRLLSRAYLIWLIPLTAATLLGLLDRIPADLAVWRVEAEGLLGRLVRPMNIRADPYYPLRVGLTCLEGAVMFWVLSTLLVRAGDPNRRVKMAVRGWLWGMTLVSLIAVAQYATGANLHEYWVRANPDLRRSHATLDDPNALASYLVLGTGLASGVAWSATTWRQFAGAAVVAALTVTALVTTVSRAGWVGLMAAVIVCTAMLPGTLVDHGSVVRRLRRVARGIGLAVMAAGLLWTMADLALPDRTTSVPVETPWDAAVQTVDPREPLDTVLKGRLHLWRAGLDLAEDHWLLGAGLGNYPRFLSSYPGSRGPENAHNYFIQVLAEAGTIGLAGLLLLLIAMALAVWPSSAGRNASRARLAVGVSMGLLAFVLTWLTGHPLLTLSNQLALAATLAVGVAAIGLPTREGYHASFADPHAPPTGRGWLLHRAWIPSVLLVTFMAAVPRVRTSAEPDSSSSHASGLYGWESGPAIDGAPADVRFRWTRGHAIVREPVQGPVLRVPFYVPQAHPVTVEAKVGGVDVAPVTFSQTGWHTQSYDLVALLGEQAWQSKRVISLELKVSPVFVPAEAGASSDTRELGVGLGVLTWGGRSDAP
jgi:O-antigen ligase